MFLGVFLGGDGARMVWKPSQAPMHAKSRGVQCAGGVSVDVGRKNRASGSNVNLQGPVG